jgi:hypothetical protein
MRLGRSSESSTVSVVLPFRFPSPADLQHVGRDPDVQNPSVYYLLGRLEFARELLSSTSLALMTVAQALTFLLFFLGLTSGLVKQRHIETCAAAEREGVLFRGLGWLALGMKLSMLETAFGWVTPSFGLIFLRRGIHLIGRACIIIGVVKGFVRANQRRFSLSV